MDQSKKNNIFLYIPTFLKAQPSVWPRDRFPAAERSFIKEPVLHVMLSMVLKPDTLLLLPAAAVSSHSLWASLVCYLTLSDD